MNFKDDLIEILILSLGQNRNLWNQIDKIYYKNEDDYYEIYLENKNKYIKNKLKYSAQVEEYINKVVGIYEFGVKQNNLSNF